MGDEQSLLGFAGIGKNVTIWPLAKLVYREQISIGNRVIIDDFVFISGAGGVEIGNFVHIASFVSITGGGGFWIYDFATIATGTKIITGTDTQAGPCLVGPSVPDEFRLIDRRPVVLERFAQIGASATILPGVTIDEGAVVGAGALVLKNCESWTVYVGVPAKPIRVRPVSDRSTVKSMADQVRGKYASYISS